MECVRHVQKRLRKQLRDLKKVTEVEVGGGGGKNAFLTDSVIDSLTVFYEGAIQNFPKDVD